MALRAKITPQSRDAVMKRLRQLVPEAEVAAAGAQEVSAKELAEAIKARAPAERGEFVRSIKADKLSNQPDKKSVGIGGTKDPNAWGVFANYIWRWLEFGTRPHTIKAKKKSRLSFFVGGKRVSTKQVLHPGIKAKNFIFPTYRQYKKRIRKRVADAINKAIKAKSSV